MAETYRERAERGAALLDRLMPSWFKKVDVDKLDLSSCYDCVCGQLAAKSGIPAIRKMRQDELIDGERAPWNFITRWFVKKLDPARYNIVDYAYFGESFEHGFIANSNRGYRALDAEWGRLVRERLEKAAQS